MNSAVLKIFFLIALAAFLSGKRIDNANPLTQIPTKITSTCEYETARKLYLLSYANKLDDFSRSVHLILKAEQALLSCSRNETAVLRERIEALKKFLLSK